MTMYDMAHNSDENYGNDRKKRMQNLTGLILPIPSHVASLKVHTQQPLASCSSSYKAVSKALMAWLHWQR